jgi:hypothetical protein
VPGRRKFPRQVGLIIGQDVDAEMAALDERLCPTPVAVEGKGNKRRVQRH